MATKNAKKSRTKKAKRSTSHYPVVRQSSLMVAPGSTTQNAKLLRVHRELSKLNRRLYRSGRYYQVKIDMDHEESGNNYVVLALRDDWAVQKGFQMAYQAYLDNTMDERERLSETNIARWEDFRVKAGLTAQEVVASLWDETIAPVALTSGEFQLTRVVDAAGVTRTFTFAPAPAANEYGILTEYDKYANAQGSPESVSPNGPYVGMMEDIDTGTMDNLQDDGNLPPYDQTGVNSLTPWVKVAELGATTGAQRLSTGFFTAPCGFVVIYSTSGNIGNLNFEVKSGDYKGVDAPSMIEVSTINRKRKVVK